MRGCDKNEKIIYVILIFAINSIVFTACSSRTVVDELGMEVPDDSMFLEAPFADTCELFDITFTYDDSAPAVAVENRVGREIRWDLSAFPKEGVEVKDFYCTLVLNDWIVSQSSSPTLRCMGLPKHLVADIPSETKGSEATSTKFIDANLSVTREFKEQIVAPVNIMLAFDNRKEYYLVKPEFKKW